MQKPYRLVPEQVHATERVYGGTLPPPASSEARPATVVQNPNGEVRLGAPARPLPLRARTWLEWAVLHLDWQRAAVWCARSLRRSPSAALWRKLIPLKYTWTNALLVRADAASCA